MFKMRITLFGLLLSTYAATAPALVGDLLTTITVPTLEDTSLGDIITASKSNLFVSVQKDDTTTVSRGSVLVYGKSLNLVRRLVSPVAKQFDGFGQTIAIAGKTVIVGSPTET